MKTNPKPAATILKTLMTGVTELSGVLILFSLSSLVATADPRHHERGHSFGGERDVTVMTRNVYVGADFAQVLSATDPNQIPVLVAETYAKVIASDFPSRARGLAREIAEQDPDLIGLQEITTLRKQSPGDTLTASPTPASDVVLDYLAILHHALAERHLHYRVAAIVTNIDVELPMLAMTPAGVRLDDVRVTDYDVILVRADLPPGHLQVRGAASGNYQTQLTVSVAGAPLVVARGWCALDVWTRGRTVRFVNTHLENFVPLIRYAQSLELVAGPAHSSLPTICLGDFNSDPRFPAPEAHGTMVAAGFHNAWSLAHPQDPGYTWGQDEDLLNPISQLTETDDYIWLKGNALGVCEVELTGDAPQDRVRSHLNPNNLLWPSDHAGISATVRIR